MFKGQCWCVYFSVAPSLFSSVLLGYAAPWLSVLTCVCLAVQCVSLTLVTITKQRVLWAAPRQFMFKIRN